MIEVKDLYFYYDQFCALKGINLRIEKGSIVALVGPNGSGKTTLMRSLLGLSLPLRGEITIRGINVMENAREVHQYIGYLSDTFGVNPALTVEQSLRYSAGLYNLKHREVKSRLEEILALVGLTEKRHDYSEQLSRGERQRLALGQCIIHQPELLILDEPTSGLDPNQRRQIGILFQRLNQAGVTLLVSSHLLEELDHYATHLLSIDRGEIRHYSALHSAEARIPFLFTLADFEQTGERAIELIAAWVAEQESLSLAESRLLVSEHPKEKQVIVALQPSTSELRADLLAKLVRAEIAITQFSPYKQSLEHLYFSMQENGDD